MGKTEPTEKFGKLNQWKICVSRFLSAERSPCKNVSTGTEYHCWPLWKNWKMAAISLILIVQKNFKLLTPPKFGTLVFRMSTETEYHRWPLWKNWKMAAKLLGVGNLKFFRMININEMAIIFQFFHNGRQWYSINTRKTGNTDFPSIQFSKLFYWFSFPCHPS